MTQRRIYLDYNATAPLLPQAKEAMRQLYSADYGNASSRHSFGRAAWEAVEQAREQVANLAGAHPDQIIFTSGATESNFLSLLGRFDALVEQGRSPQSIQIAASPIEHPCVVSALDVLKKRGAVLQPIPVKADGRVDASFFEHKPPLDIAAIMAVNHETGAIQPIQKISHLVSDTTYFHCDAAQWAGRCGGGFQEWSLSAMTLSAHKIGGPKGVGALILKSGLLISPQIPGAQEAGMRGGTVNSPAIAGFGAAAEAAFEHKKETLETVRDLRELLWRELRQSIPTIQKTIADEISVCNTLHVHFPGLKGERVVDGLDQVGIACSSGPACASGASDASPVLQAMGWSEKDSWEGVRFSLGPELTEEEIRGAVTRISIWFSKHSNRPA